MRLLLIIISFFIFLLTPSLSLAQTSWVINDFHSDIHIVEDGRVRIRETIKADFGNIAKHGIFRDIPYIYQQQEGSKYYTEIEVTGILKENSPESYQISYSNGYVRIKIGNANQTITGPQTYKIEYYVTGILKSMNDYDELYWNVTGDTWEVPVQNVSALVTLSDPGISKITCYEGLYGSTSPCEANLQDPSQADFKSTRSLNLNENLSVVVGYAKGLFPILTVASPKTFSEKLFTPFNGGIFLITFLSTIFLITLVWHKHGRDFWWRNIELHGTDRQELKPIGAHETIVVEYESPEKLRPAEIGVLMDERADTLDVTVTIIDLAVRGYLTITEEPKKWLLGSTDYIFKSTKKDTKNLLKYESELLERLFATGDTVSLSSLKTKFYDDLAKVKTQLYKDIVSKNFFPENPETVRTKYMVFGFILMALGIAILIIGFNGDIFPIGVLGAGLASGSIFLILISFYMPRKTAYGREMYRRIQGYKMFITRAEKYKQQFFERKNMLNEILPYAIVFGVTEKFAQALKDMGIEQTRPTWYYGTGPFNPVYFGSNMAGFSNAVNSSIAAHPSGTGGFSSGGGSSGGGFGGGGGGSW